MESGYPELAKKLGYFNQPAQEQHMMEQYEHSSDKNDRDCREMNVAIEEMDTKPSGVPRTEPTTKIEVHIEPWDRAVSPDTDVAQLLECQIKTEVESDDEIEDVDRFPAATQHQQSLSEGTPTAEKRVAFYNKMSEVLKSCSDRSSFMDDERYEAIIQEVKQAKFLKNEKIPLSSKQYRRLNRYDVLHIEGTEKLIENLNNDSEKSSNVRYYCKADELFDVLETVHMKVGHKRKAMEAALKLNYCNVTRDIVKMYLGVCLACPLRRRNRKKRIKNKATILESAPVNATEYNVIASCNNTENSTDCVKEIKQADVQNNITQRAPENTIPYIKQENFQNNITQRAPENSDTYVHENIFENCDNNSQEREKNFDKDVSESITTSSLANFEENVQNDIGERIPKLEPDNHDESTAITESIQLECDMEAASICEPMKYQCNTCNEKFRFLTHLMAHMLMHNNPDYVPMPATTSFLDNLGEYVCDICNKAFDLPRSLKRHQRVHTRERIHECTVCNKMFKDTSQLNRHMQVHTGEKPRECTLCNKKFTDNSGLTVHMRTHTGEKPYGCSMCIKRFTTRSDLKKHLMMTHTKEKPHACNLCEKRYAQKGDLRVHLLTHTGEKPHSCPVCNKSFTHKSAVRPHLLTHTGEKPYKCPYCDKAFTQRRSLRLHKSNHELKDPSLASPEKYQNIDGVLRPFTLFEEAPISQ